MKNIFDVDFSRYGEGFKKMGRSVAETLGIQERDFGIRPESADAYLDRNVGRTKALEDIAELQRLKESGGRAAQESRELQKSQAAGQVALARGAGGVGSGLRLGAEAAGKSFVESEAPVAMTKEAAKLGYTKQEAAAVGLMALSDTEFRQSIRKLISDIAMGEAQAEQQGRAGLWSKAGTAISIASLIASMSDERAKTNVKPITKGAPEDFLRKLNTGGFDYRPEFGGERGRMGPILNEEVANTEVGRSFIRRDPQTGYLMTDPNAAALTTMALLKEQNERIEALEAGKKGKKKAPQERPLLLDRLQPPPSLDRANVTYAEDVRDHYPGWAVTPKYDTGEGRTPGWVLDRWREERDAGLPRAGGEQKKWLEFREGGPFRENRLPEFLEHNLRGYFPIGRHHVPYESREALIEKIKKKKSGKGRK